MPGLMYRVQNALTGRRPSKDEAKQRLKAILIHDKVDLTRAQMDEMRAEILTVIGKYVEIDTAGVRFCLDRKDDHIALESSVPVRRMTSAEAS